MLFAQDSKPAEYLGFHMSKRLTQVIEFTYNRRALRYANHAMAEGQSLHPELPESPGSNKLSPCCDCF